MVVKDAFEGSGRGFVHIKPWALAGRGGDTVEGERVRDLGFVPFVPFPFANLGPSHWMPSHPLVTISVSRHLPSVLLQSQASCRKFSS